MIFKEIQDTVTDHDYEEVPQEELWEDGECRIDDVREKILYHTLQEGDWMIVRRISNGKT